MLLSAASGRPTPADVLPNCLAALRGEPGPLGLGPARTAIVLLVDGLGASMLRARSGHARHLTRDWGKRHTAFSFPSTTVAGITSLTTAQPAGAHGLCAYQLYDRAAGELRNQLSGWGDGMDPATWQLQRTVFEGLADAGGPQPVVVGMADYAESGFTAASLRGAAYVPAGTIAERIEATLALAEQGSRLIYVYVAELDQAGHKHGWESDAWLARLEEADAAVADLEAGLPSDIGLLVTADHGMIDIAPERQIDVPAESPLLEGVVAVAGEPRLRHLALADEATPSDAAALAARWNEAEGRRAIALTREEAIAARWYGEPDRVHPAAARRLGDVIVAATKGVTYYGEWMQGAMRALVGQHGSISPEETIVPLIRKGAFTPRD